MSRTSNSTASKKAADAAHDVVDKAAENAEVFEELLRQKAEELMEAAGSGYQNARDRTESLADTVSDYVENKPLASLGIAFVVGLAVSSLLRK